MDFLNRIYRALNRQADLAQETLPADGDVVTVVDHPDIGFTLVAMPAGGGGGGGGAPVGAEYLVVSLNGTLTNERRLQVGTGLAIADGGANADLTVAPALDLAALEALGTTGIAVRTGTSAWTTRTLGAPAAGLTWTNGDGVSGAPTLALANDLAALEGLGSTGYAARTAADTWAQRTITGSGGITVTNGNGVAGDTNVSLTVSGPVTVVYDFTTVGAEQHFVKPTGHTMISIEAIEGGGGGGAGRGTAVGGARGGGGGGGSGATSGVVGLCPPDLYVVVGRGGAGGIAGGTGAQDGGRTTISTVSGSTADANLFLSAGGNASSGGSGGSAGTAAAASAGAAGQIATEVATSGTIGRHGTRGVPASRAGQVGGAGGNGTTPTVGATVTPGTGTPVCSGAGGGAVTLVEAHVAAGGVNASGAAPAVTAGTVGGGAGGPGVATGPANFETFTGGAGGGGNNAGAGGTGGAGSIGCGGGGGGGGTGTGTSGGTGGAGGPGRVRITTW